MKSFHKVCCIVAFDRLLTADFLSEDEDMNAMHLTDKKNGIIRELNDHEELETLLESFSKQVEEIVNEADTIMV